MGAVREGVPVAAVLGIENLPGARRARGGVGGDEGSGATRAAFGDDEVRVASGRFDPHAFNAVNSSERSLARHVAAQGFGKKRELLRIAFDDGRDALRVVVDAARQMKAFCRAPERRTKAHALNEARKAVGFAGFHWVLLKGTRRRAALVTIGTRRQAPRL